MPPSILATIGVALYMAAILGGIIVLIMLLSRRRSRPQQHNPAQPDQQAIPTHAPAATPSAAAAGSRWEHTHYLPYTRQRQLLTQAERDFFAVLRAATPPGWYVFPQVRLANLVLVKKGTRNWKPHFGRVAQKCVDFVLCDGEEISPRLVVELDDASHNRPDRQDRDAFVALCVNMT